MKEVEVVERASLDRGEYVALLGFAGTGFIGNTALMYAARSRGYTQVATVKSDLIPPMILLINGQPNYPFRIYVNDEGNLLFVVTESIIQGENVGPICRELMKWLISKGVIELISFEGLPYGAQAEELRGFGFTLGERNLAQYGIQRTTEGAISGLSACLLDESMEKNIDWSTIFIPASVINNVDYSGAAKMVEILNSMFDVGVDPEPLRQSAQMMRRAPGQDKQGGFLNRIFGRNP
jgi:predicted ATP-grasp superfamily ATP-dependent carboligase